MVCNDILYVISNKFRLIYNVVVDVVKSMCVCKYRALRPRDTDTQWWIGITPVFTLGNSGDVCVCVCRVGCVPSDLDF